MRTGHILAVDDDDRLRDLLKRYLTREGHDVTTAKDARHAPALEIEFRDGRVTVAPSGSSPAEPHAPSRPRRTRREDPPEQGDLF